MWDEASTDDNEVGNGISPSKRFYFDSPTYGNGTLHVSSIYDLVEDFNINAFTTRWLVYPDFYYKLHAKVCDENDKTLAYDESEEKLLKATRLDGIETLKPDWKPLIQKVELKARISILGVLVGGTLKVHFHVWVCLPDGSEISRDIPHPDEEISVLEALDRRYTKTISSSDFGMDWLIGYRYYVCIEGEYNKSGKITPVNGGVKSFVPGTDWYTKPQVDTNAATHDWFASQNEWRLWGYLVSKGDPFKWVTMGFRYMEVTPDHSVSELYKEGFNLTSYVHEVYPLNYRTYVPRIKYSREITINPNKKYAYIAFAYYELLDGTYVFGFGSVYYLPGGNLTDSPEVETVGAIPNSTKAVLIGRLSKVPENVSGCNVGFKYKTKREEQLNKLIENFNINVDNFSFGTPDFCFNVDVYDKHYGVTESGINIYMNTNIITGNYVDVLQFSTISRGYSVSWCYDISLLEPLEYVEIIVYVVNTRGDINVSSYFLKYGKRYYFNGWSRKY